MNEDDFYELLKEYGDLRAEHVSNFEWDTSNIRTNLDIEEARNKILAEHKRLLTLVNSARTVLKHEVTEIANLATMVDQVSTNQYMTSVYSLIYEMEESNE